MSINNATSPVQISTPLYSYDTVYEITLAWSNKTYSIAETWDAIKSLQPQLNFWLRGKSEVERTIYCIEYTKKFHPHVHIAICCNNPLDVDFRHGVAKGLRRQHPDTRVTFSQVVSKDAYNDYLEKDLANNHIKYNINHKTEYDF